MRFVLALLAVVTFSGTAFAQAPNCRVLLSSPDTAQHESLIVVAPSAPVTLEAHCIGAGQPTFRWFNGATSFFTTASAPTVPGSQQSFQVIVTLNNLTQTLTGTVRAAANGTPVCTLSRDPTGDVRVFTTVRITANCPGATSYTWSGGYDLRGQGTSTVTHVNIVNQSSTTPIPIDVVPSNASGDGGTVGISIRYILAAPSCRITANPSGVVAPGVPVTLTAQCDGGTIGYGWNTGALTQSIQVTPAATTSYAVTANNAAGLSVPAIYTVAVSPTPPVLLDYTGHWWAGAAENGWGMTLNQHGQTIFGVIYFYDATGEPTWAVMPGGSWNANLTAYTGDLYTPTGSPYTNYDASQLVAGQPTGSMTITFTSATTATLGYQLGYSQWDHTGQAIATYGQKQVTPLIVNSGNNPAGINVADMWWGGPAQNGWGISINQRNSEIFSAWFTYGLDRRPIWFVLSGNSWNANTATTSILRVTGNPWLGVQFVPKNDPATSMGTATLGFADAANGAFDYSITTSAGPTTAPVTGSKPIVRQSF